MRVLRVITRLDLQGGAEMSTLVEVEELAARGHDVMVATVVTPAAPGVAERLDSAGVSHRHLGGGAIRQVRELRRLVRAWRPQVVHAVIFRAELLAVAATARLDVALLVSLVNMQYDATAISGTASPWKLGVVRRFEALALRAGADHFHCLTEAGARHSVERLAVAPDRITVIPRGRRRSDLDIGADQIEALRSALSPSGAPLLVNVGRHERQKGQDLLVEMMDRLRDSGPLRLVIAGRDGNQTAALRDRIEHLGLTSSIELLGSRGDVAALLTAATVVCVSSRWEGLGGAIVEALGVGAPVVAFATPAVAEVIGDAGVLVEPFDVDALARAVEELVANEARRTQLGERARSRFATRFDLDGVVDRIETLYEELAKAGSTPMGQ